MSCVMEIGIIAGDIWHYLDDNGSATADKLVKDLGKDKDLVFMSLGWLAREGHIKLESREKGYLASLIEKKV